MKLMNDEEIEEDRKHFSNLSSFIQDDDDNRMMMKKK